MCAMRRNTKVIAPGILKGTHLFRIERIKKFSAKRKTIMDKFKESFEGQVHSFLVSNVESFNLLTTRSEPLPLKLCRKSRDLYGDPLPLEVLMRVPVNDQRARAIQILEAGDVVEGHVIVKTTVALGVKITSLVSSWKSRAWVELDLRGLVPAESLADSKDECEVVLRDMQVDDVVQAVVTGFKETQLELSFRTDDLRRAHPSGQVPEGVALGYLEDEIPKKPLNVKDNLCDLRDSPGFANPSSTENLKDALGISGCDSQTKPTLILHMQKKVYLESEFSSSLRKQQRFKWSMETVAVAVKYFKEGDLDKALGLLHHALDIDPRNVEGLVARGALFANRNKYRRAIADFEAALTENSAHRNARKYLVETRVAYGEDLEREGCLEEAAEAYREAVADGAGDGGASAVATNVGVARERLGHVREILEREAAEQRERERKEAAERSRIKKLHSIIKEEKKRKERKEVFTVALNTDRSDRKKHKRKKKKYKTKKSQYSSDEESLQSSDTEVSRLYSHKKRHHQHHRSHRSSKDSRHSPRVGGRERTRRHLSGHSRSSSHSLDRRSGRRRGHIISSASVLSPRGKESAKCRAGDGSSSLSEDSLESESSASPPRSKKDRHRNGRHQRERSELSSPSPPRQQKNRRESSERRLRWSSKEITISPYHAGSSSKKCYKEKKRDLKPSYSTGHHTHHHHLS